MQPDMFTLIRQVHHRFAKYFSRRCASANITLPQYMLLMNLIEEGEQKMNTIARFLQVSTPAITNLVDKLEASGYVRRLPHPDDRRAHIITLTPEGEEFVDGFRKESLMFLADSISALPEPEREVVHRFYTGLIATLDEALAKQSKGQEPDRGK